MPDWLPWLILGGVGGWLLGFRIGYRAGGKWHKGLDRHEVIMAVNHTIYLRELAAIPADKVEWMARQLVGGVKFRGLYLERRYGGQLTHKQFNRVRDEMLERRIAYKHGNVTDLTLAGMAIMRHISRRA